MNAIREISMQKTQEEVKANLERRHLIEKIAFGVLWAAGGLVVVVLFFVIFYVLLQGGKYLIGPEPLLEAVTLEDSNGEVRDAVTSTPGAIGYMSFGYVDNAIQPINLNGVVPTQANAESGAYPVMHGLYLMTQSAPDEMTRAWLDFVLSDEGQQILEEAGYVPLENPVGFLDVSAGPFSGELTVSGSTTVQPLAEKLAEAFSEKHPDVTFVIEGGGSSAGIKAAGKDRVNVGMSSRDVRDYELNRYEGLTVYPIGYDGIAVVAHPDVPIDTLSINKVREIFTGAIENWQDVGGPDLPITVISRKTDSGTWDGFEKWVLGKDLLIAKGFRTMDLRLATQGIGASLRFLWRFLTTRPLPGMGGLGGISTTIVTTIYMVLLTLLFAAPLGVGAAVYLVEYAGEMGSQDKLLRQVVEIIRFAVETLAGVPSIIYGLFGFALFVTVMHLGFSLISGALAGACLILPVIIRTTEEALLTVPRSYREGSLALGATKWQTNYKVILPAAMPGIVTGIILGVGRIVSETAVFYVTLGGSIHSPKSIFDQGRTMVLHLYSLMMDANASDPAMGTAVVLLAAIILINLAINYFSNRLARSMSGKE